jgi:hypothetical protein
MHGVDVVHGRDLFEIGAHRRVALVSVLDAAEVAAIGLGGMFSITRLSPGLTKAA